MSQVTFDALKFVETPEVARASKDQAKVFSVVVQESHCNGQLKLATRRNVGVIYKKK